MAAEIKGSTAGVLVRQALQKEAASSISAGVRPALRFEQVLQQAQSPDNQGSKGKTLADYRATAFQTLTASSQGIDMRSSGPLMQFSTLPTQTMGQRMLSSNGLFPPIMSGVRGAITPGAAPRNTSPTTALGELSARFESGRDGASAIGYDAGGGTSYGIYQIASRVGTMERFLDYLDDRMPAWAQRLRTAGPANTGSRQGGMPAAWRTIAAEDPKRFTQLQHEFIEKTHYLPALEEITQRTGVNLAKAPTALQEVLWSTAVQHGPKGAANIFSKAIAAADTGNGKILTRDVVESVYATRAKQFGSANAEIQAAVQARFHKERQLALTMTANGTPKSPLAG